MQLHTTADGQEHEMSVVSYPTWSSSTSHEQHADPSADGKYNHSWPSQAYHCTFCPRVFRTAQALGGHMNIHRRERAFANDIGTHHFHSRRGDSSQASNSILSRSSSHPAATPDQLRSSLFSSTPPAPSPVSYKENCYANRRIAVTPDSAATHLVTTANFFAPIQAAEMTYHHRVGWNHGGNAAAKLEESSGHNISDPLSWLFSQLPPPGSVSTPQRQQSQSQPQQNQNQQQQQQQQCRGGNVLMQKNLAKPYHRAAAVRQSGGHPSSPFSEQDVQARGRWEAGSLHRHGEQEDGDEGLDLELRL